MIAKLLDPKTPEFTATFVGKLVSVIISKVGSQLGEDLDLMLRSVLGKMQRSETLSVIQVDNLRPILYLYSLFLFFLPRYWSSF